ncbi:MAG: GtrA family protein [Acidobacteria bacterium]|nr:GtrA family protein [Acidobacteriota bacterium]
MEESLSNKTSLLQRWLKFSAVGCTGIAVQLITLNLLLRLTGLHYLLATALAVELSVLHNFAWHSRWTWADRQSVSRGAMLLRFNLTNGALSIFGNLFFMWLLVGGAGMEARVANVLTIAICALANFILSDLLVFT